MIRFLISLLIFVPFLPSAQDEHPFQVLTTKGASIYGDEVKPLQLVNDVTSIEVMDGGFISLVHKGGTTYEHTEKIFTFYLKPEKLKNRQERPQLELLYQDSVSFVETKLITILHPSFDRSDFIEWNAKEPFEFFWHLPNQPFMVYILTVSDGQGIKIQDFRTKNHEYTFNPSNFGLQTPIFMIELSSTFAGETMKSKPYQIQLTDAPIYEKKATDFVLKALDLEISPLLAIKAWKQALELPNGEFYKELYGIFLKRNKNTLIAAGEDVELLLSQNK